MYVVLFPLIHPHPPPDGNPSIYQSYTSKRKPRFSNPPYLRNQMPVQPRPSARKNISKEGEGGKPHGGEKGCYMQSREKMYAPKVPYT